MRRILPFIAFAFFFVSVTNAQEMEAVLRRITSPLWLLDQEAQERPAYYRMLSGETVRTPAQILFRMGEESLLDLTEEQNERFFFLRKESEIGREVMMKRLQSPWPEYEQTDRAMRNAVPQDDPYFYNASEEQKQAYLAAATAHYALYDQVINEEIQDILTPEQMEKVQLLKMQLLPEMGLPSVAMFEPLGLSDEQKKEMEAIRQEMLSEFDQLVDEAMSNRREYFKGMLENVTEMNKAAPLTSMDDLGKAMRQGGEKMFKKMQTDKDWQQRLQENAKKGQNFATRFRDRLMNVLTDEQLDKMQKIMDDSPEFVKRILQAGKQQREAVEKSGQYQPGPDSWRPGDGLPKDFKLERQEQRFPSRRN